MKCGSRHDIFTFEGCQKSKIGICYHEIEEF